MEEGIPQSGSQKSPQQSRQAVDESHGWFPNSMKMNAVMASVEGTILKRNNSEKKRLLIRRPSGNEVGSVATNNNNDLPVAIMADQVTGIKRLPSSTITKIEESNEETSAVKLNYQPTTIGLTQAKSIANLPTKSTTTDTVKRVQSSNNVAKIREKQGLKNVPTKSALVNTRHESKRGKMQRSATTPARIVDNDDEISNRKSTHSTVVKSGENMSSKKVK